MNLNDRVRQRLKAEKERLGISERDLADRLNWSQSKIAQKFGGRTPITLDELDSLRDALGVSATEVVRDHGLEFCAEMTPIEFRALERFRPLPPHQRDSILALFSIKRVGKSSA